MKIVFTLKLMQNEETNHYDGTAQSVKWLTTVHKTGTSFLTMSRFFSSQWWQAMNSVWPTVATEATEMEAVASVTMTTAFI